MPIKKDKKIPTFLQSKSSSDKSSSDQEEYSQKQIKSPYKADPEWHN